jgi:hypothetical protein
VPGLIRDGPPRHKPSARALVATTSAATGLNLSCRGNPEAHSSGTVLVILFREPTQFQGDQRPLPALLPGYASVPPADTVHLREMKKTKKFRQGTNSKVPPGPTPRKPQCPERCLKHQDKLAEEVAAAPCKHLKRALEADKRSDALPFGTFTRYDSLIEEFPCPVW